MVNQKEKVEGRDYAFWKCYIHGAPPKSNITASFAKYLKVQ